MSLLFVYKTSSHMDGKDIAYKLIIVWSVMFKFDVAAIVAALFIVACYGEKKLCDRPCALVRCVVVEPADCKPDEVFVSRDGLCYCCDTCVKKSGTLSCNSLFIISLINEKLQKEKIWKRIFINNLLIQHFVACF